MEKEQKLKMFHITLNKSQFKAISKLADTEFSEGKSFNIKILNIKLYKDSNNVRVSFGYFKVRDLVNFMYCVGYMECLIIEYEK